MRWLNGANPAFLAFPGQLAWWGHEPIN